MVVIGGGHNGLVCTRYLARTGLDLVVLEAAGGRLACRMPATRLEVMGRRGVAVHAGGERVAASRAAATPIGGCS